HRSTPGRLPPGPGPPREPPDLKAALARITLEFPMSQGRGLPPLEDVCLKAGGRRAFRLHGEYFPGPVPFPESDEEAEWLKARESFALSVVARPDGWLVTRTWKLGAEE